MNTEKEYEFEVDFNKSCNLCNDDIKYRLV